MSARIILLRGINLGPNNRIPMAELREMFAEAGYEYVRTYVQSGNVVLSTRKAPDKLARECEKLIEQRFGLDIPVVARTREEIAAVVKANPLEDVAKEPKRYQVSFLAEDPDRSVVETLDGLVVGSERCVVLGREIYAWHPEGIARSKLWNTLAGKKLGVNATARNWKTVTALLAMADEVDGA